MKIMCRRKSTPEADRLFKLAQEFVYENLQDKSIYEKLKLIMRFYDSKRYGLSNMATFTTNDKDIYRPEISIYNYGLRIWYDTAVLSGAKHLRTWQQFQWQVVFHELGHLVERYNDTLENILKFASTDQVTFDPAEEDKVNEMAYKFLQRQGIISGYKMSSVCDLPDMPVDDSNSGDKFQLTKKGGEWCYSSTDGEISKSFCVHQATEFKDGMAGIRLNSCWGFIDERLRIIVPPRYGTLTNCFSEGLAAVCEPQGVYGLFGYINKRGQEVIPLKYDLAYNFHEGLAVVMQGEKCGVINKKDQVVIDFSYDTLSSCVGGTFIYIYKNEVGVLDKLGGKIISKESDDDVVSDYDLFDNIISFNEDMDLSEEDGRWVFRDEQGKVLFSWDK